jgi:regulator of sigma E protease
LSIVFAIIKTILMLGILVIIHEGGHFLVAKLCKIKVNEFSVGFGKSLFSKEIKGTKYSIRIIPLRRLCKYGRGRSTIR